MSIGANRNQFGTDFVSLVCAETVQFGPVGIVALGEQGGTPWRSSHSAGASDELTGMEAAQRYGHLGYPVLFDGTPPDISRQIESSERCR